MWKFDNVCTHCAKKSLCFNKTDVSPMDSIMNIPKERKLRLTSESPHISYNKWTFFSRQLGYIFYKR